MMEADNPTTLEGQILRVTYTREDTGYTVARIAVDGIRDPVTVVGTLIAPTPGEMIRLRGEWTSHPTYGRQFRIHEYDTSIPSTIDGIRKYLGSGLIRGLGPVMAERIVDRFGEATLDVIDNQPHRLTEVDGIGEKRAGEILSAWHVQRDMRDTMIMLQSHGVGPGMAIRIFKRYGERSAAVIQNNPYRLAVDIRGIGFRTADSIADKFGFARTDPARLAAGLHFALAQAADEGHTYLPEPVLMENSESLLGVEPALLQTALEREVGAERLTAEPSAVTAPADAPVRGIFLPRYHHYETTIARRLTMLAAAAPHRQPASPERALAESERRLGIVLAPGQREAVIGAFSHAAAALTGGPGTGKTTIIRAIAGAYRRMGARVMLAAPTGRAAKRMSEATGHPARTIHRLLEFSFQKGGFQRNAKRPLAVDILIVDEASMMDCALMNSLLAAVPAGASLLLVGDVHQLPSVGAGQVLTDIIQSGTIPVYRLTEIYRQAARSRIVVSAHRINDGKMPALDTPSEGSDFYFIEQEDPDAARDLIVRLVGRRIPERFGLHPVDDIQVLTPMHRGAIGAGVLNQALQEALNPNDSGVARGDRRYGVGDKVMQMRNNYEKEVFNGDIGRILSIDPDASTLTIRFDQRQVAYEFGELDEITLAYAVSVHKAQGSEYPAVVMPVMTQHYVMLQRNLVYTGITRGRRLVVLVGSRRALAMAVGNAAPVDRFTRLGARLAAVAGIQQTAPGA